MLETRRAGDAETLPTWRAFSGRAGAATKATASLPGHKREKEGGSPDQPFQLCPPLFQLGKFPQGGLARQAERNSQLING